MKYKWHLFWCITIFYLLGVIVLGLNAYTNLPPKDSSKLMETIKVVFLCLGGLGIILPVYVNAINAIEQRRTDKIENTFKLIEKWDDSNLFSARKLTREIKERRKEISDKKLIKEINKNEELKHSVHLVCNYLEQVRFSIETNRIDVKLFKPALGPVVIDIINRFMPYVQSMGDLYVDDLNKLKKSLEN